MQLGGGFTMLVLDDIAKEHLVNGPDVLLCYMARG